jgi:hypothetical protein
MSTGSQEIAMLSITRYRNTRYWALWEGGQLLAVTVYKKGDVTLMRRLQQARKVHGTTPTRDIV